MSLCLSSIGGVPIAGTSKLVYNILLKQKRNSRLKVKMLSYFSCFNTRISDLITPAFECVCGTLWMTYLSTSIWYTVLLNVFCSSQSYFLVNPQLYLTVCQQIVYTLLSFHWWSTLDRHSTIVFKCSVTSMSKRCFVDDSCELYSKSKQLKLFFTFLEF